MSKEGPEKNTTLTDMGNQAIHQVDAIVFWKVLERNLSNGRKTGSQRIVSFREP